jgi:hypothetical protein
MKRLALIVVLVAVAACGGFPEPDPCEGRWDRWYCQLRECQPDPEGGIPEGMEDEWIIDRRTMIDWEGEVYGYDPELHCLNPDPACCPPDWFECPDGMERCG